MDLGLPLDSPHCLTEEGGEVEATCWAVFTGTFSVGIFWIPLTLCHAQDIPFHEVADVEDANNVVFAHLLGISQTNFSLQVHE